MKFKSLGLLTVILSLLSGCGLLPFLVPVLTGTGGTMSFDMDSAKAIAATGGSANRDLSYSGLASRSGATTGSLVKILEDGTTASLIDFGTAGTWQPDVAFLSTGDDGSVYICFQGSVYQNGKPAQFIRVYPDNHYDVLWPPVPAAGGVQDTSTVSTWSWWGMDSDPLARAWDGTLYFKVTGMGTMNGLTGGDNIYRYDPATAAAPVKVTPEGANLSIGTFMIDKKGHLFIQSSGMGMGGGTGSYLRMYTKGTTAPANLFYSSSGDTWVRGYTTSPEGDYVILNGNNVRGMNGIIKISIASDNALTYDLLYANANANYGSWIWLAKGFNDTWDNPTTIIKAKDIVGVEYAWLGAVKTEDSSAGTLVRSKLETRIKSFFYLNAGETMNLTPIGNLLIKDTYSDTDLQTTLESLSLATDFPGYSTIGNLIQNNPESFLRACYTNKLFKDWINEPSNALLKTVDFNNVGAMMWATDGLYALYGSSWWGGGASGSASVIKLTTLDGTPDLKFVTLKYGEKKPSSIKIIGDWLYYRYAVLDSFSQETGSHKLARKNITTGIGDDEDLTIASDMPTMEILTYDVSEDNAILYFVGFDASVNKVVGGKIDLATKGWSVLDTATKLNNIRIIK